MIQVEAGEDIKIGQIVVIGDDGKLYAYTPPKQPLAVAARDCKKDEVLIVGKDLLTSTSKD